ncbi:MAG: hypothetical protein ACD_70C00175G0001 [uncultured bacterium]|nr:MAG: hypothetical protein ACD_70C00175G0001 [uncultured bacterium]
MAHPELLGCAGARVGVDYFNYLGDWHRRNVWALSIGSAHRDFIAAETIALLCVAQCDPHVDRIVLLHSVYVHGRHIGREKQTRRTHFDSDD